MVTPTRLLVSGEAVDIGAPMPQRGRPSTAPSTAVQIYSNESWHYELRPEAIDHGCPPMYADPTHDPRTSSDHPTPAKEPMSTQSRGAGRT